MKKSIIIIIFFIIVAFITWAFSEHKLTVTPTMTNQETNNYKNDTYKFSANVPSDFIIEENYTHYLPADGQINGVRFTIPPAIHAGTNLSSDTAMSIESLPTNEICSALLFTDFKDNTPENLIENEVTYSVLKFNDAGAGNRYEESIYAIPGTTPCLGIRYFIHYGAIQNYPEWSVKEFNQKDLLNTFDAIRKSIKRS